MIAPAHVPVYAAWGAAIFGLAQDAETGEPDYGWVQVLTREHDPPLPPEKDFTEFLGEGAWTLPLLGTWDHEPSDEEFNAVKPEQYREEPDPE